MPLRVPRDDDDDERRRQQEQGTHRRRLFRARRERSDQSEDISLVNRAGYDESFSPGPVCRPITAMVDAATATKGRREREEGTCI